MRKLIQLVCLCAVALTAMALGAGQAAAQESPIEAEDEALGGHCDPCVLHFESTEDAVVISHVFGHEEVASACHEDFTAEIYEDGAGHITDQDLSSPTGGGSCTQQACDSTEEAEWPITELGETGPGTNHFTYRYCLEDAGGGTERHCDGEVQLEEGATDPHHLTFHSDEHCPITFGVESEKTHRWEAEAVPDVGETNIELHHL